MVYNVVISVDASQFSDYAIECKLHLIIPCMLPLSFVKNDKTIIILSFIYGGKGEQNTW